MRRTQDSRQTHGAVVGLGFLLTAERKKGHAGSRESRAETQRQGESVEKDGRAIRPQDLSADQRERTRTREKKRKRARSMARRDPIFFDPRF